MFDIRKVELWKLHKVCFFCKFSIKWGGHNKMGGSDIERNLPKWGVIIKQFWGEKTGKK